MKPDVLVQELEAVAQNLAIKVRYEPLDATIGVGGLCRVKGEYRIIIDRRATMGERAQALAEALAQFDTSTLKLSSPVRELIAYCAVPRAS